MGRLLPAMGFVDAMRPLARLRDELERAFEDIEVPGWPVTGIGGYPALNTWADDDNAYVEAELPGVTMEQIDVSVTRGQLSIRGERKDDAPQGAHCHRTERPRGTFARTIELPWEIDAGRVDARLRDGVLTVNLPKAESAKPRKVKVVSA